MVFIQDFRSLSQWSELGHQIEPSEKTRLEEAVMLAWRRCKTDIYWIPGLCSWCERASIFRLDAPDLSLLEADAAWSPNWRESLECMRCRLNNRIRASWTALRSILEEGQSDLWIAEQQTPFYRAFVARFPTVVGSEYVGASITPGSVTAAGIRHEDMTGSSFATASLSVVLSFDVLEHVAHVEEAFREAIRVLKPGGHYCWTAPFGLELDRTEVRATVDSLGRVTHILEPEYHGDPMNPEDGILSYRRFGWGVLEELREAGFSDSFVRLTRSWTRVNLGQPCVTVVAVK